MIVIPGTLDHRGRKCGSMSDLRYDFRASRLAGVRIRRTYRLGKDRDADRKWDWTLPLRRWLPGDAVPRRSDPPAERGEAAAEVVSRFERQWRLDHSRGAGHELEETRRLQPVSVQTWTSCWSSRSGSSPRRPSTAVQCSAASFRRAASANGCRGPTTRRCFTARPCRISPPTRKGHDLCSMLPVCRRGHWSGSSCPYIADYKVGIIENPRVRLADAVAASSAFPPVPLAVHAQSRNPPASPGMPRPHSTGNRSTRNSCSPTAASTTIWASKRSGSDTRGTGQRWRRTACTGRKAGLGLGTTLHTGDGAHRRPGSHLRKRQIIGGFVSGTDPHEGTYWGIRSNIGHYGLTDALVCPQDTAQALANTPTRLKKLPTETQNRLMNWGYAICDASLREHFARHLPDRPAATNGVSVRPRYWLTVCLPAPETKRQRRITRTARMSKRFLIRADSRHLWLNNPERRHGRNR